MVELLQLAAILLTGPLLLTVGTVAWVRHNQRQEIRRQSRHWRQRFLEGR